MRKAAPRLESNRLILRAHRLEDFEASAALWADPVVVHYITGEPSTREQAWSRMLRYPGHWALLGFGYWVVEAKGDGRFIGEVGFADYQREMTPSLGGMPEAGWVLKTAEHGRGFATEAVARMLAWADEQLDFDRTVCIFDPQHKASLNVARKSGYRGDLMAEHKSQPTLIMSRPRYGQDDPPV